MAGARSSSTRGAKSEMPPPIGSSTPRCRSMASAASARAATRPRAATIQSARRGRRAAIFPCGDGSCVVMPGPSARPLPPAARTAGAGLVWRTDLAGARTCRRTDSAGARTWPAHGLGRPPQRLVRRKRLAGRGLVGEGARLAQGLVGEPPALRLVFRLPDLLPLLLDGSRLRLVTRRGAGGGGGLPLRALLEALALRLLLGDRRRRRARPAQQRGREACGGDSERGDSHEAHAPSIRPPGVAR